VVYSTLDEPADQGCVVTQPAGPTGQPAWPASPPPPPRAPREARWIPTAAVLVIMLFVTFGGFLFAGETGAVGAEITGDGGPGAPIQLGSSVVIHPPGGWVAEPSPDSPEVRLSNGVGQMYAAASPVTGSPEQQLQAYIEQALSPQASQLSVTEIQAVEHPSGNDAAFVAYLGTFEGVSSPLEGEVAAVVAPSGTALILDGWAPEGQFVAVRDDVRATVLSAEVS
jgi:hypothetical protein